MTPMDKIEKTLKKLSLKEREYVKLALIKLNQGDFQGLNIVKLKGQEDIFRMRTGQLRIIFRLKNKNIFILAIERRSEKTYRNF